ncbi:MAG: D-alanine--D-alanine ligase [Synergistaceae bacterium]|jgi:D-alanine-D-alanine ligase|nr:D-alanine--D-alanine ligase [Synergistaceae bacterium]
MAIGVGVFFGGRSVEHEVSVISALQALHGFDKEKYDAFPVYVSKEGLMYVGDALGEIGEYRDIPALLKKSRRVIGVQEDGRLLLVRYPMKRFGCSVCRAADVAFPVGHGTNMEDGALQGYFRTLSVPFAGSGVAASAVGMDKHMTKAVLRDAGIPVLDCERVDVKTFFRDTESVLRHLEESVSFPMVVKPLNLGSSIGIAKVSKAEELREALETVFHYANAALAERAVPCLRELNCAVLGDPDSAAASECEEPLGAHLILDYSDKYLSGGKTGAKGMSAARRKFPADISPELREEVRSLALRAFHALGCRGVARVDFLMDGESGRLWVNEVNTIPGSLSFYLWEPTGLSFGELLGRLVDLALKRERENAAVAYSFETNILSGLAPGAFGPKNASPGGASFRESSRSGGSEVPK